MKELSIEQKAKAYDEVIKKLRDFYRDYDTVSGLIDVKEELANLIPELAESKDEKIRKEIIAFLTYYHTGQGNSVKYDDGWIAWLEKQGEQKSQGKSALEAAKEEKIDNANKAEPKFKAEDWVVCGQYGAPCQIESIKNGRYYFTSGIGIPVENVNIDYHLWTIQEAKDGDVLFTSSTASHETFIFKSIDEKGNAKCYFAYDSEDGFREGIYHFIGRATNSKPATKEQRDTLFVKMKEAGYEWDAEKKELKKIEQKSSWSEEDENMIEAIEALCDDKIRFTEFKDVKENAYTIKNWLISLKKRYTWKPSGEQMIALKHAFNDCPIAFADMKILATLYEQLKALHHYEQDT